MGRVVCNISGDSIALVRSVKPGISKDCTSMESSSFGELKISLKLSSFGHGSGDVTCIEIVFARQKKIGRASCRERVELGGGGDAAKKKRGKMQRATSRR